jgi:hypothetical protein
MVRRLRAIDTPDLPRLSGPYAATLVLASLVAGVSVVGILARQAGANGGQRPSVLVSPAGDLANLLVLAPALVVTTVLARRGGRAALLAWPGVAFYTVYVYAIYLLTAPFTALVLGHLVIVVLAATLLGVVAAVDVEAVRQRPAGAARVVAAILVALGLITYAGLASQLAGLLGDGVDPAVRAQWVVDAALGTPPTLLAGVLLWRRHPWGYPAAAAVLVLSSLGGLAFAVAGLFDSALGGTGTDPWVIAVHLAVSAIAVLTLVGLLRRRSVVAHPRRGTTASTDRHGT